MAQYIDVGAVQTYTIDVGAVQSSGTPPTQTISPDAIPTGESWDTPAVAAEIGPSAIPSGEHWFTPGTGLFIEPDAIATSESWDSPTLSVFIAAGAIPTSESWGIPLVTNVQVAPPVTQVIPFSLPYYLALLTSQYRFSYNLIAWLSAVLQVYQDAFNCLNTFNSAFDLGQAVGPQLDILGVIVGQSRTVAFQPSNGVSPILDDTTYRTLLQATVYKNHWGGTTVEIRALWYLLFPGSVILITDNQNMTVDFYVGGAFTSIMQDLITNGYIIPRPQGVQYTIAFAEEPIFATDLDTASLAGWDTGYWAG